MFQTHQVALSYILHTVPYLKLATNKGRSLELLRLLGFDNLCSLNHGRNRE